MENINCTKHGPKNVVLCCQHLSTNNSADEVYLVPEEGEEEATIWCGVCETARIKDKGWFDYADSIACWKVICSGCLDEIVSSSKTVYDIFGWRTPG